MASSDTMLKIICDPVHNLIRIRHKFILDLLNTAAMQRLRRVRQLGLAWLVYPGAEHSRFAHSLGVFHLAGRVMNQLEEERSINQSGRPLLFDDDRRRTVLAAALLHDVGHGPFSHAFEHIITEVTGTAVRHEDWTVRIIREEADVQEALAGSGQGTITDSIVDIIRGVATPHYMTAILSSQLDVDRFDYLLRDSHMTGSQYGKFDLEWMLRTLAVREVQPSGGGANTSIETIVVDGRRGLDGLEAHLIGRHYMYRHVYFHKTIRAAEMMLRAVLTRAADMIGNGATLPSNGAFQKLARGEGAALSTTEYLTMNDFVVLSWIEEWARSNADPILRDLSGRLIARRLFKAIVVPRGATKPAYRKNHEIVEKAVVDAGYNQELYFHEDAVADVAYKNFFYNIDKDRDPFESALWLSEPNGTTQSLSSHQEGVTFQAKEALSFQNEFWFVPPEVAMRPEVINLKWKGA